MQGALRRGDPRPPARGRADRRTWTGRSSRARRSRSGGLQHRGAAHARPHRRDAQLPRERRRTSSRATRCSRARSAACARPARPASRTCKHSIMDVLMKLPPETHVHPGHTDPTTVGDEWEKNAFIRALARARRGGRPSAARSGARTATLVLWAPDYDGGHKAWVRWADGTRRHRAGQPGRARLDRGPVLERSDRSRGVGSGRRACSLPDALDEDREARESARRRSSGGSWSGRLLRGTARGAAGAERRAVAARTSWPGRSVRDGVEAVELRAGASRARAADLLAALRALEPLGAEIYFELVLDEEAGVTTCRPPSGRSPRSARA